MFGDPKGAKIDQGRKRTMFRKSLVPRATPTEKIYMVYWNLALLGHRIQTTTLPLCKPFEFSGFRSLSHSLRYCSVCIGPPRSMQA